MRNSGYFSCRCYGLYLYRLFTNAYSELNSLHFTIGTVHQEMETALTKVLHFANSMIDRHHQLLMPLVGFVMEYKNGAISKSELFEKYCKNQRLEDVWLKRDLAQFEVGIIALRTADRTISANFVKIHNILFDNKFYYITNSTYQNRTLGQMLMAYENVAEYAEHITNFSNSFEANYVQLIEAHFHNTIMGIEDMSSHIIDDFNMLITYMTRADDALRRFHDSTLLDTTFFMQVLAVIYQNANVKQI